MQTEESAKPSRQGRVLDPCEVGYLLLIWHSRGQTESTQ